MAQFLPLLEAVAGRVAPPVALVLGAPRLVVELVNAVPSSQVVCYQMDLFQADRLREELSATGLSADVKTAPDLWDLQADFQTVIFPSPPRGERDLKIDMIEQGFHLLRPKGTFIVLSPVEHDQFYPKLMKKIFGKSSVAEASGGTVVWATRDGDRPRRRHEVAVQARVEESGAPLRFLTRPGVFTYGRMDLGTRALLAAVEVKPGERLLDLGCGTGAAGIAAALRAGPTAHVTFVDSNVRAVALAELNAQSARLTDFRAVAAIRAEGLADGSFDVVMTNPPYYGQTAIAQMFVERSRALLKPGGRFYLVTKQFEEIEPIVRATFGEPDLYESRGYIILVAAKP
ncbi:MAG: class I SAM-dependent methyltransferase [Gemmataceae bacterium]